MKPIYFSLLLSSLFLMGCEGFFGTKTRTDFLDVPIFDDREAAYVPIQPVWEGFVYPTDIVAGFDQLIYVADSGASEIISFDQAGNELGRFGIPGLSALTQDNRLNLLATGTFDTLVGNTTFTLPAIYRIDLFDGTNYGLPFARIDTVVVHPFYFKAGSPTRGNEAVRFSGIAALATNEYYVTRTGPSNLATQFGGPDDAVILFNADDGVQVSPLVIQTSLGIVRDYFKSPSSIVSLPRNRIEDLNNIDLSRAYDFLFTAADEDLLLRVQGIQRVGGENGVSFVLTPFFADTSKADQFLYDPGKFVQPADITVADDLSGYIFVVDAAKDSLYQFNSQGYEGIEPVPGATDSRFTRASFGGRGTGLTQFHTPRAVAYQREIVYVADAGNGRILRFQLTRDFD